MKTIEEINSEIEITRAKILNLYDTLKEEEKEKNKKQKEKFELKIKNETKLAILEKKLQILEGQLENLWIKKI